MALELPSGDELTEFEDELTEGEAIARAADLLTLATGLSETPSDPFEQRLVKYAILEMAWALRTRHDDQEAVFSPFSSERLGSYSYSKASTAVQDQKDTGVPWFDKAVAYFNAAEHGIGSPSTSSEQVFAYGEPWTGDPERVHPDPSFVVEKLPRRAG